MTIDNNPFDDTIWDPNSSEQAIEDPIHGPSAVFNMLQTPAMPYGDGRYYQPGLYSLNLASDTDSLGRPIMSTIHSGPESLRFAFELAEWVAAHHDGGDALKALEAKRQQARLQDTGLVQCFKPSDVCAGGERLGECQTAVPMVSEAQEYAATMPINETDRHSGWTVLAWLGRNCTNCELSCEIAVQTEDGKPIGINRFTNYRPLPLHDIPSTSIEL